jgi:glycosyltransferase involved in cell wall biosynthesis
MGHEVSYFFSGRHYPGLRAPRMKRWHRNGVNMYEAVNAPIPFALERGTRDPERDLSEPWLERAFAQTMHAMRPDVVHVQELAGLPSSLLEITAHAGVPALMTLQDYLPLCSTMRLYDSNDSLCLRRDVGADCVLTNAKAPADASPLVKQTLHFELQRAKEAVPVLRRANFARIRPIVDAVVGATARVPRRARTDERVLGSARTPASAALPREYQRRREVNVQRLKAVDLLVAQSARVAEIYRLLGVDSENTRTLGLTVGHLESLRPRVMSQPPRPVTFATLGACGSRSKGANLVLEALGRLSDAGYHSQFRLLVYGFVDPDFQPELAAHPAVSLRGVFRPDDLDGILEEVDVGLLPSVWEEAFGYVGLEFLAKGIPLVANPVGGIVEYARADETAWLNTSRSGEGLAAIMAHLIAEPERIVHLHRSAVRLRGDLVKPMKQHAQEMAALYAEIGAAA